MKVLVLSPYADLIEGTIRVFGDDCIVRGPDTETADWPDSDWVISFGYRKIIPHYRLERFQGQIINIHCSFLPWNRGADPNFWSWFHGTPKGVTIHRIADGIDSGEMLAQQEVRDTYFRHPPTLRTTYDDLLVAASGLFTRKWPMIKDGSATPIEPQSQGNTYHRSIDKERFMRYLSKGWDTEVGEVEVLGELYRGET